MPNCLECGVAPCICDLLAEMTGKPPVISDLTPYGLLERPAEFLTVDTGNDRELRIVVCGDRDWGLAQSEPMVMKWFLAHIWKAAASANPPCDLNIMSGGARGADSYCRQICQAAAIKFTEIPADWERYGRGAGPIRNEEMLTRHNPHMVLCFHNDLTRSKGSLHTVKLAVFRGIYTLRVNYRTQCTQIVRHAA